MWDDVLGQETAKRILRSHLASDRVANAYLLAGPAGVGKCTLALEMAKALNCTAEGVRPCDVCRTCAHIIRGIHPDVHHLKPGGAAQRIRIDDVRHLLGRIALQPFNARWQVGIIEGVERLTEEAANSLLKALEEPPSHTRFVLTTSHLIDCLPTIISRCQLIRCQPLPVEVVTRRLRTHPGTTPEAADAIARLSGGSVSRALELSGRWAEHETTLSRLADRSSSTWLEDPLPETREGVTQLLDGMMSWLRDLAVTAAGDARWVVHTAQADALRHQADVVDVDRCLETVFELVALRESIEQFANPRLVAALAREKWLTLSDEWRVTSDE